MTQLFTSHTFSKEEKEKQRIFTTNSFAANRQNSNGPFAQKIKNLFRMNSGDNKYERSASQRSSESKPSKPEKERSFRNSRFLPHIGRNRSATMASEGNMLEESHISPTANANPYFIHQGLPALRHHNDGSVPPSPPDTPPLPGKGKKSGDKATAAGKEELARKLRRVASAPNAQGMFAKGKDSDRPSTAELGKEPLMHHSGNSALSLLETGSNGLLPLPPVNGIPTPGQIRESAAFRRTYSSNSIKVRSVEVGPGSFDKIKLIGKGDVGKVYLVREKKSTRLYAMKGEICFLPLRTIMSH